MTETFFVDKKKIKIVLKNGNLAGLVLIKKNQKTNNQEIDTYNLRDWLIENIGPHCYPDKKPGWHGKGWSITGIHKNKKGLTWRTHVRVRISNKTKAVLFKLAWL